MAAIKIDGNAIAKDIREKLHAQIDEQQKGNPRFKPSLKIIQGMRLPLHKTQDSGVSAAISD